MTSRSARSTEWDLALFAVSTFAVVLLLSMSIFRGSKTDGLLLDRCKALEARVAAIEEAEEACRKAKAADPEAGDRTD